MNGEDRRRKAAFLLLALAAVMAVASAAFAVQISLPSADIAQIGGTGQVDVNCPVSGCQISRVTWTLSGTPPRVTEVNVRWTPASDAPASYTVYVTLYDGSGNIVGSGSAPQSGSATAVTTPVPVSPVAPYTSIDPKDVYKVEIVIVQTAF